MDSRYTTAYEQFHQDFLELETELGLFDLTVDGVPVWERVRSGVSIDLLARTGLTGTVHAESSLSTQLTGSYLMLRNLLVKNPFLGAPAEIVMLGHPRRKRQGDAWVDIYCDPLYRAETLDAVHLEPPWQFEHKRPAQTPNLRYTDLIEFLGRSNTHLELVGPSLTSTQRATIGRAEERFEAVFDVSVDLTGWIRDLLQRRAVSKPLYDRLLARLDPELAVVVAHSDRESFVEACHDANIPVAELQHGQISPYSYQHAFPGSRTKQAYPDYLLTFGEFWEAAASFPLDSERIIPVGYPYLERELDRRRPLEQETKAVFVSTPEAGPILSEIATDISQRDDIDHDVVFKLHPDEYDTWTQDYPWLVDAPLTVVADDGPTLYDIFAESSVQVGVGSTALYEGLAFELTTYLFPYPTIEWLAPVIENGAAQVVESADDLATKLRRGGQLSVTGDAYFQPNAVENATAVLQELTESGTCSE